MASERGDGDEADVPLSLRFEGPHYDGEMVAGELSDVLSGLDVYVSAIRNLGILGDSVEMRVVVRAMRPGSFDIQAIIQILGVARDLGGVGAGFAGGAFFGPKMFRFWWENMRAGVINFEHNAERGTVVVTHRDGTTEEWSEEIWRLYNDRRARKSISKMTNPLRRGAKSLHVKSGTDEDTFEAHDGNRFVSEDSMAVTPESGPSISRFDAWAMPDTVRFDPKKPWGLIWGGESINAVIEDKTFLHDLATGQRGIYRTDVFRLAMRAEIPPGKNVKPKYYVERVIEQQGGEQHELPLDGA